MVEGPAGAPSPSITPVQQMVASSAGALLTTLFVTPLDVVKIRLQSQQAPVYKALPAWKRTSLLWKWKCFLYCHGLTGHIYVCQNTTACSTWYKTPTHFSGTLDAFVKITRSEGLRSLWSGLPPTLLMAVPTTVIYFTCYDQLKDLMCYGLGYHSNYISIIAGSLARPMYWFNYELIKAELCERYRTPQASFTISFASGAISGAIAAITTLPFDVVKTRRQIELGEMEILGAPSKKPSSTWLIMKSIWTETGYRGLFAGFLPRVIKVAPACAIMISTYEFGKAFFRKHNEEQRGG
ncbi:probable mitochondrial glutathione transporter SLC25A39 isoform X3 [Neoarius graeffei]|uniref:probable mitochondrial glutathione transporter SLC25A39 isoform X3 n=1 Tax=Neoarius graeffei TaxID=443677 RepID=UPI00298C8458|nr:probable mitochondrial glutathione transporter SLC25A39 isoform X3 [Neoarius graeffei]